MNLKDLKNIARAVFAAGILFSAGGCADEGFDAPDAPSDGMTIRFYSTNLKTRATAPSDASLNENLISNITIALYPSGAADNIPAVKFKSFEGISGNGEWETKMTLSDAEVERLFGSVTATGATCRIFAVANISDQNIASLRNAPTIADMKALPVTAQFDTRQDQPYFVMTGEGTVQYNVDSNNNKTATGEVALDRTAAKITLNLKFGTRDDGNGNQVPVVDHGVVDAEGNTWKPLVGGGGSTGAMRVLLNNGVKNSEAVPGTDYVRSEEDYFNITTGAKYSYDFKNTGSATYPYSQEIPFYTYPNKWANTPQERRRTAMTLLIPWGRVDKNNTNQYDKYSTFYYTVPVTASDMPELISNNIYQVNLSVGMLGSLEPEAPATLEATYQVVDWGNAPIDVDISETRYLVVSPTVYEVDNVDLISIPFYSSHEVVVKYISLTYQRFNSIFNAAGYSTGDVVTVTVGKPIIDESFVENDGRNDKWCETSIDYNKSTKQYTLGINHPLKIWKPVKEDGTDVIMTGTSVESVLEILKEETFKYQPVLPEENAYSPYDIVITLAHKDAPEFTSIVTIHQYPMMYISREENPGTNNGNRFVNDGNNRFLGSTVTPSFGGSSGHANPNMYIINVTSLGIDSEYVIGDPRTLFTNNQLDNVNSSTGRLISNTTNDSEDAEEYIWYSSSTAWCSKANALYDGSQTRTLRYYYPTDESNSTENMVAPQFRMASSWGTVSGSINAVEARRRCATYQEMGCPAGRWRLPTFGEIRYIVELHEKGYIPSLFTAGASYLSAQGWVYIPKATDSDQTLKVSQNPSGNGTVRAVYDDWYWNRETGYVLSPGSNGRYTYTLGDMPKRNPQN